MRLACLVDNLDVDNLVSGAQLGNDVLALDSAAKHRVAGIKVVLRTKAEVELGTGGIGFMERAMASAPSSWLLFGFVRYSALMQ